MPGLKAAQTRSEFGFWHGLSVRWELSILGGTRGTDLWLQVCTEPQPLVPVTPSCPVEHPKGGFTHSTPSSCGPGCRLSSPCRHPELPKGETDSPNTV